MRGGRPVVCGDPQPPASIAEAAHALGADLRQIGRDFHIHAADRQQWSWSGRTTRFNALAYPALRGANQLLNAAAALAALEALRERLPINAQAVREGLATVELTGRFQVLPGQPAVVLDVAHNPHAAAALARNLDQMGFYPRTLAVFGAMADKDIEGMLVHLLPLIDAWHLCELPTPRAATAEALARRLEAAGATSIQCHATPAAALAAAKAAAEPPDRIVVFGSFYTVGGVLRRADSIPSAPRAG
jgi:dihydrofolate synthase/folylpolyglutamate synthase